MSCLLLLLLPLLLNGKNNASFEAEKIKSTANDGNSEGGQYGRPSGYWVGKSLTF